MFVPSPFIPSNLARQIQYDEEGRLKSFNISRQSEGGIGDSNSLYATDAERFNSIAPFLKVNRLNDAKRRNYIVQPGGACIYFEEDRKLEDPYDNGRVQYTVPDPKESFGHDSMPGRELQGVTGSRVFTVSEARNTK